MVKQKERLNIMIDDISDEGVDFHSIEPVEDLDDDEKKIFKLFKKIIIASML